MRYPGYIGTSPEYENSAYGERKPFDSEDPTTAELEGLARDYEGSAVVKSVDLSNPEVVPEASYQERHKGIETDVEDSTGDDGDEVEYDQLTVAELKDELDSRGVDYPSSALKADLVELLEENDADSGNS